MNRPIKFRAWHKGFDRPEVRVPVKPAMLYEDRQGQCLTWKEQGQPLIIMQFTGLLDKNGKEIYEGDIVKGHRPIKDRNGVVIREDRFIGAVKYDAWWGGFRRNGVKQYQGLSAELMYAKELEVIGNIFETPELSTPC